MQCGTRLAPTKPKGRSSSTTKEAGYSLDYSGGRPSGTTQEAGYRASDSGGWPSGTTQEASYRASDSGGQPSGTTQEAGYRVFGSGGRPRSKPKNIQFDESVVLCTHWDHSEELLTISSSLLDACGHRIAQQRTFDKKPLGIAGCSGPVMELCGWFGTMVFLSLL